MANGSFKVWLVTENGYEHTKPLRAFTLRRKAEAFRDKKELEHRTAPDDMVGGIRFKEKLWFRVEQIDLVTHDGAHALHEELYKAVGEKRMTIGYDFAEVEQRYIENVMAMKKETGFHDYFDVCDRYTAMGLHTPGPTTAHKFMVASAVGGDPCDSWEGLI